MNKVWPRPLIRSPNLSWGCQCPSWEAMQRGFPAIMSRLSLPNLLVEHSHRSSVYRCDSFVFFRTTHSFDSHIIEMYLHLQSMSDVHASLKLLHLFTFSTSCISGIVLISLQNPLSHNCNAFPQSRWIWQIFCKLLHLASCRLLLSITNVITRSDL